MTLYLITSVSDHLPLFSGQYMLRGLLENGWYVFGNRTPGRQKVKSGDHLVFYYASKGVVAKAEVASSPERRRIRNVEYPAKYEWAFRVKNVHFFQQPIIITSDLRSKLDAFKNRDPIGPWAWFVRITHFLTEHDYFLLTGHTYPSRSKR